MADLNPELFDEWRRRIHVEEEEVKRREMEAQVARERWKVLKAVTKFGLRRTATSGRTRHLSLKSPASFQSNASVLPLSYWVRFVSTFMHSNILLIEFFLISTAWECRERNGHQPFRIQQPQTLPQSPGVPRLRAAIWRVRRWHVGALHAAQGHFLHSTSTPAPTPKAQSFGELQSGICCWATWRASNRWYKCVQIKAGNYEWR